MPLHPIRRRGGSSRRATLHGLCLLLGLLAAGAAGLSAQPSATTGTTARRSAGPDSFRHYPGGKDLQGRRLAQTPDAAVAALRDEGDSQLPAGISVRVDVPPTVVQAGASSIHRFRLAHDGVPLAAASDFVAIVGATGRLLASRVRGLPDAVDAAAPTVAAAVAVDVARAHAQATLGAPSIIEATEPALEIWVDEARQGHLSWSVRLRAGRNEPAVRFAVSYRISAIDATRVLAVEDMTRDATVQVQAEVWQLSPHLPTVVAALPDASVFADGFGAVTTDANGQVVFPVLTAGAVSATLRGPFATVRMSGSPVLSATAVSDGGDTTVAFAAPSEFLRAQTTAFLWTSIVNRWVRAYLPVLDASPTPLDGLEVNVNDAGTICNAFYAIDSVTFGRAGAGCQNMATPTLVAHELGHGIHFALATGRFDVAYSEGFGDAVAALVTDQPCVGAGMFAAGSCLRDLTHLTTWPVASTDPHQVGEPYAQFAWGLRERVGNATAAASVLGAVAAAPQDIPDAVFLSFVVDDDDGLLGTCSPHQRALEAAADRQLLPRPQSCRPAGENAAPTAADDLLVVVEDAGVTALDLVGNDSDPDGDQLEVTDVSPTLFGQVACDRSGCTYTPHADAHGVDIFTYTAVDTFGGAATATARVEIAAVEDVVQIAGPFAVQGLESAPMPVVVSAVDPDGPAVSIQWVAGSASAPVPCVFADPQAASTTLTCTHEGVFPFAVIVTQGATQVASATVTAEVLNAHPSVTIVTPAPGTTFAETALVTVVAAFEDGPTAGAHSCDIDWGDGTITAGVAAAGACTADHAYAPGSAGPRVVAVGVTDPGGARGVAAVAVQITSSGGVCGPASTATCVALGAGFVGPGRTVAFEFTAWAARGRTGGQWALLDGARFHFVAVVQAFDVSGRTAVIRGVGAVNGRLGYTFEASVNDRTAGPDRVRIVVRDGLGGVVRDIDGDVTRGEVKVAVVP